MLSGLVFGVLEDLPTPTYMQSLPDPHPRETVVHAHHIGIERFARDEVLYIAYCIRVLGVIQHHTPRSYPPAHQFGM